VILQWQQEKESDMSGTYTRKRVIIYVDCCKWSQ